MDKIDKLNWNFFLCHSFFPFSQLVSNLRHSKEKVFMKKSFKKVFGNIF